jgi:hypothetical protein
MVDYTNAIKKPFSDMKNLVIGGIISIIPLVNFISMGNAMSLSSKKRKKSASRKKIYTL